MRILECVPNFSEGRDPKVIEAIAQAVDNVEDVKVLHVDAGEAANRTVITFAGEAEAVVEAAFRAVQTAALLIDMRQQHGAHPRIGATDVLPLVPVSGITLEESAELARGLAKRISDQLGIPTYCYEASAFRPEMRNLAVCRSGEYEGLAEKLVTPDKQPDFGARPMDEVIARSGATVVGARDFLIAVNYNLNTASVPVANEIACDVRERGRALRNPETGEVVKDQEGKTVMQPGTLKCVKAIGWYIDEYGIAQVSMNMTNIHVTPLHIAYEEVCRAAAARGVEVTGTEIIGLVPKQSLIDAGKYFSQQAPSSAATSDLAESDLIQLAINKMGLDDLRPFNPQEKIIEECMRK